MTGFLKLQRSPETEQLLKDPNAFALLAVIAYRARRDSGFNLHGMNTGEAMIGDFTTIGLTRQQYREATGRLVKWGFATTRATNRGTVAKLIDARVWDINAEEATTGATIKQPSDNHQATIRDPSEQPSDNHQATTNKKGKKEKNSEKEREESKNENSLGAAAPGMSGFDEFWELYPKRVGKGNAERAWKKMRCSGILDTIMETVRMGITSEEWTKEFGQYIPHPATWLNRKGWEDQYSLSRSASNSCNVGHTLPPPPGYKPKLSPAEISRLGTYPENFNLPIFKASELEALNEEQRMV